MRCGRVCLLAVAVLLVLFCYGCGAQTPDTSYEGGLPEPDEALIAMLNAAPFDIIEEQTGFHHITMDGFVNIGDPGEPNLPVKTYKFILPPSADLDSVRLDMLETEGRYLHGSYEIDPGAPYYRSYDVNQPYWGEGKNIIDGKNANTYGKDAPYPPGTVKLWGVEQMRKWKFAAVRFAPFQYNPVKKSLILFESVKVRISFLTNEPEPAALLADAAFDSYAEEIFDNFETAKSWYIPQQPMRYAPEWEYVICTTDSVKGSGCLDTFIAHKQSLGFTTYVWTGGSNPLNWLKDNYAQKGISYLLIVAAVSTISPGRGDEADIRYVDLTSSGHSTIRAPELFVGRIETNDTDTISSILNKVIAYETATEDIDYRHRFYIADDLCGSGGQYGTLMDTFAQQIGDAGGFQTRAEHPGNPIYNAWPDAPCGVIYMRSHGDCNCCGAFNNSTVGKLNNSKPAFAFVDTCRAGEFGCLCWKMLENGCIAVMTNNYFTWGHFGSLCISFETSGTSALGYFSLHRVMVDKNPVGDSLHLAKFIYGLDYALHSRDIDNNSTFHLKGDPSVRLTKPDDLGGSPTITTRWLYYGRLGRGYKEKVVARGGKYPYNWALANGSLPNGLVLNPESGEIYGTPTNEETAIFTVSVTDAEGENDEKELWIDVADFDEPGDGSNKPELKIITSKLPTAKRTLLYTYTLIAHPLYSYSTYRYDTSDSGVGEHFHWKVTEGALPDGLTIREIGGCIRGTPAIAGMYSFTITATGAKSDRTASKQFTLEVIEPPPILEIVTDFLSDGVVNQPYNSLLTAQNGELPYKWSIADGNLPDGLNLDLQTGEISGTPTTEGTSAFTVQVTDTVSEIATKELSITITDGGPPPPFQWITTSLPDGIVGESYIATLEVEGGALPYSWSWSGSTPPGLNIGADTAKITGTPTVEGDYPITIQVTDNEGGTAQKDFIIHIDTEGMPVIITTSLQSGTINESYTETLTATGGAPPYSWSIIGDLPPGLVIESTTGIISGTPTQAETYNFTVKVTDSEDATAQKQFSITVKDDGGSPPPDGDDGCNCTMNCSQVDRNSIAGMLIPYLLLLLSIGVWLAYSHRSDTEI